MRIWRSSGMVEPTLPIDIPSDWCVRTIRDLAAAGPFACVGGPFGSDLTTKDYVATGVPVIRGGNLNTQNRWVRESDFVFVTEMKANDLARNLAFPGDLVFTQRGTLGQVARVHPASSLSSTS